MPDLALQVVSFHKALLSGAIKEKEIHQASDSLHQLALAASRYPLKNLVVSESSSVCLPTKIPNQQLSCQS